MLRALLALALAAAVECQLTPPNSAYPSGVVNNPVPSNGAYVSNASLVGTFFTGSTFTSPVMASGTVLGYTLYPESALKAALAQATSSQCQFIESAFEEGFQVSVRVQVFRRCALAAGWLPLVGFSPSSPLRFLAQSHSALTHSFTPRRFPR